MTIAEPLTPEQLYTRTNLDHLNFETTNELNGANVIIGQPRALDAIRFGVGIEKDGYNIFALGPEGAGKRSLITQFFQEKARQEQAPPDWIYVQNFDHDNQPNAIRLPSGKGSEFQRDMEQLVEELQTALSAGFESDEYRARRQVIEEEIQEQQEKELEKLQERAKQHNLALLRTPGGLVFAPVKDGEVIAPEEFKQLPEDVRSKMEMQVAELQELLQKVLQKVPGLQRQVRQRLRELNRDITMVAVSGLLEELQQKYHDIPEIPEFLTFLREDIVDKAVGFISQDEGQLNEAQQVLAAMTGQRRQERALFRRYQVNLLVDNSATQGVPVIYEDNPTYQNLIGEVEYLAQMGALLTDFTLIKPGSLHRANGGYLILDARKILQQPYAWEALKRSLKAKQIKIESLGQMLGLLSTVTLEPEPIPLDVKVALLGDRWLYYRLSEMDPEFRELFKVQADFEEKMPRDGENQAQYAEVLASIVRRENLRPFDRSAVVRVIEHSARLAGDAERVSIEFDDIIDLLSEADYWAGQAGKEVVGASDVEQAIDAQIHRADRLRERFQESILREIVFIATEGSHVGQVNGVSVVQLGEFSFGFPSRITARVRRGKGEVVNIEREVNMSGPIHSKGVLILSGYLGEKYASEKPLSLSASLVFEQSYSGVEGDSASSAELYALLSAIAEVPVKQSFAITGSVNQHGQVQAIGGANEKIEGFFDICNARGLTGNQGVLIPAPNVKHLMLRQNVIEAVAGGKFRIFPISDIDQGIELLTGIAAGSLDENGDYPADTINGKVQSRLARLAEEEKKEQDNSEKEDKVVETLDRKEGE
ncbi:MAG TPA: AAA family ATPase [Anaerolineales bacterium]|nr:AAA family ATPase [Anaerolineales bacterium]